MLSRKRVPIAPVKVIHLGSLRRGSVLTLKEDPLEAIIRSIAKPLSLRERVKKDPITGMHIYHPSHAYFEFMSKMHPLRKPIK